MSWRQQQSRDRFFRQAQRDRYRARSAYKLLELNERFRLIRPGSAVVDLGAAPGSWSQVAVKLVGPTGVVVAVDLTEIERLGGVITLQGDIRDAELLELIRDGLGRPADVVLSDVSPQVSGNRITDHARSIELADASLSAARELSRRGAHFVVKVFRGSEFDNLVSRVRRTYAQVRVAVPAATREESREAYVVGLRRL